jgi:SAM-dependent methyltransferase
MSFANDHFSAVAARYAEFRPHYPDALVDALADRSPACDLAWDVGCGNGQLSVALARRFARVIATDPSSAQLASAQPHDRVDYRCEPAEASTLADASADLVVVAQAAHWFDWPRFVAEVSRVARPSGLVALVVYGNVSGPGMDDYRTAVESYWPPGREHVDNGYRDLVFPWPAIAAPSIEMTEQWTRDDVFGYATTWSSTQRMVKAVGPAALDELRDRLAAIWPDNEPRTVSWPLTLKLSHRIV